MAATLRAVKLGRLPVFQQLCIEEALFYKTNDNWYLFNEGPVGASPTVVLGISGKPEKMCNLDLVHRDQVPMIKRFSGGGTVVVDEQTIFGTIIASESDVPECRPYPRDIMEWSMVVYSPSFKELASKSGATLGLRENDYVFGTTKFGGNAQAISRGRWLHHTSFLWTFSAANMAYLQLPEKQPEYRRQRPHESFLTTLEDHVPSRDSLWPAFKKGLQGRFTVHEESMEDVMHIIDGLGGMDTWGEKCRTKYVGLDGKPAQSGHKGYSTSI